MVKYFNQINWLLWGLQVFFLLASLTTLFFYFNGGGDLELLSFLFLFWCSFHCFMLKKKHKKHYINQITDFTKHGGFKHLNRRGRRTMKKYFSKMKSLNK